MGGSNFVTLGAIPDPQNDGLSALGFGSGGLTTTAATVVPAAAGKRISIFAMTAATNANGQVGFVELTTAGATVTYLNGSSTGNPLQTLSASGMNLPYQNYPWFTVGAGNAFGAFCLNATVNLAGRILYLQG